MPNVRETMKTIDAELTRVRAEIAKLQIEEGVLVRLRASITGEPMASDEPQTRKRAASVKPLVLSIVIEAQGQGMTSADVERLVKGQIPGVADKTVGSVLSRLKSDGVLSYVGERYYEKRFAPAQGWTGEHLRAVN